MKRNFKNIFTLALAVVLFASSCKENELEEVQPTFARTFSASGLKVTVLSKVNALFSWDKSANAKSYTIELYETADFSGTPARRIADISRSLVQYTVNGLEGDTKYYARLKAVGNESTSDSKWKTIEFATDPEQLLNAVDAATIRSTSATVTWPAATAATKLVLTPGDITRVLTPTEIAAGSAIVTGLTPETTYTVKLLNGTKVRGNVTFKSGLNLSGYTEITNLTELNAALAASGPQRLALYGGTYAINSTVAVNKNITLTSADPSNKPVITGAAFKITSNASLTLSNIVLNGASSTSNMLVEYTEASDNLFGALTITGSEIYGYGKGLMYINVKALVESITIENNIIRDIACTGAGFIDFRTGFAKTFTIKNNTIYNITEDGSRYLVRIDATTNFPTQTGNIFRVENNTFYNALNASARSYFYIRLTSMNLYFNKNIVSNTDNMFSVQNAATLTISERSANNYFTAANFYSSTTSGARNDVAGNYTTLNPTFTNIATGDFTVGNEILKATKVGDLRWIK
ncbi:DUF4957 domain-containing protein [Pedobacter xixiisoli]|uniref:Fibronectin type-III domain-containing protein n=1 Tax=Pedobacter xixiisoli TaxID=1476464 RepID=A0A285ZXQ5_9SPHI|nr:DUF4957 domain-containing protein [Pedobacter xixiisoli]SOD14429.1 protein of unknown function [Pedobacter xixiisoli]